jgi:hypothetical protein
MIKKEKGTSGYYAGVSGDGPDNHGFLCDMTSDNREALKLRTVKY